MKKYDSYKDSGIECIGKTPLTWSLMTIRRITQDHKQGYYSPDGYKENGHKLVRITDLDANGNIDTSASPFVNPTDKELDVFEIKKGDILFPRTGSIGLVGVAKIDLKAVFASYLIRFRFSDKTDNSFMRYFFISEAFLNGLLSDLHGGVNQNIHAENIKDQWISLPSVLEQTAIANYLDHKTTQIDHLIAKKEQFIQLLEEERVAVINQAVTKGLDTSIPMKDSGIEWLSEIPEHWEVKKLKQIFNSSKGLTITKENLESEGIPCVNYGEIHSKFGFEVDIDKHQLKCVNPTYLESDYKSLIQTGDFVFADTSEDVSGAGNFTYLKSNHEIFAGYHTIILRAIVDIESRFFAYQFDSIPYRTQIRQSVKGIKVFSITQGILKNTSLWIPPIDEQKQIIEFLDIETDRIVSLKNSAVKEIELLKEFKTALISEVVTGKVDVRNEKLN